MAASRGEPLFRRIVLVGFMGAGKTAVGARLATRLGWPHLDLDRLIEEAAGARVAEIFAREGEAAFRAMETEATRRAAGTIPAVVSTGGGWVLDPAHREMLADGSVSVWLRVSLDATLARAAGEAGTRPLLQGPDPAGRARRLMREREPLYAAADQVVDTDHLSPAEVAEEILKRVRAGMPPA